MKCETHAPSRLTKPGLGWIPLDRKLAAAITRISTGEIGRVLTQITTAALNQGQIARGRVLLATVFGYYASGNSGQVLYDMNHLQSLVMKDNNLEAFHNTWNMVLAELATKPAPELLQYRYFKQVKDFKPLSEDVAHYRRSQYHKSPDYSFEWLYAAACRYLAQKRADYMQDALNRSLIGAPSNALPGVDAPHEKAEAEVTERVKTDLGPKAQKAKENK